MYSIMACKSLRCDNKLSFLKPLQRSFLNCICSYNDLVYRFSIFRRITITELNGKISFPISQNSISLNFIIK